MSTQRLTREQFRKIVLRSEYVAPRLRWYVSDDDFAALLAEVEALWSERDHMAAALRMIQDPDLSGKTWQQVREQQRLDPREPVSGEDFCGMMKSCWVYARLADHALAGTPFPEELVRPFQAPDAAERK